MAAAAATAREEWGRVEKNGGRAAGGREGADRKRRPCATDRWARGGQARASRPSARCPFHHKSGVNLGRDGSKADTKRTKIRLRPRAGPSGLSVLPQTDVGGQDRVARWSWPKSNSNGPTQTDGDFVRFLFVWVGRPPGVRPVFHMGRQRAQRADPYVQAWPAGRPILR